METADFPGTNLTCSICIWTALCLSTEDREMQLERPGLGSLRIVGILGTSTKKSNLTPAISGPENSFTGLGGLDRTVERASRKSGVTKDSVAQKGQSLEEIKRPTQIFPTAHVQSTCPATFFCATLPNASDDSESALCKCALPPMDVRQKWLLFGWA